MSYYRIIYVSTATFSFQEADLLQLLAQAREMNDKFNMSGMLVYSEGRFMQVLEGREEDVKAGFASIAADLRHGRLQLLADGPIDQPDFPDWHMGFTSALGDYPQLPNFTPPVAIPATGPIQQLLHEFLAEGEKPIW